MTFPKRYADRVARLRVPSGFLLVVTFAWLSRPTRNSLLLGAPISMLGLLLRAWAAGHLAKDRQLCQSGPYAWSRNPLYTGTLLVACGLVIAGRNIALAVIFAVVFLFIYLPVIELEEQHLRDLFPGFDEYARRVPRLIGIPKRTAALTGGFRPRLYFYNREYQALLGFLGGLAFLIAKWKILQ